LERFDLGYMDKISTGNSPLHRLDPGAKVIATFVFIITVVSFDRYEISALTPFFLYPLFMAAIGNVPFGYILRKLLAVSPFAVFIGIFNPIIDRNILFYVGSLGISGGWVSFVSIFMRFILTVSASLLLVAVTGFNSICMTLEKYGMPRVFIVQLLFMYRYMFVLADESQKMVRARSVRSFASRPPGLIMFVPLAGQLLLRTLDRAECVYRAMVCRGFNGQVYPAKRPVSGQSGWFFAAAWIIFFVIFRIYNIPFLAGSVVMGVFK